MLFSVDFYHRRRTTSLNFVYVKGNTTQIKSYKLKKIINSREIVIKKTKYLIRWKGCGSEQNMWRNLSEIKNAMNMIKEYHRTMNIAISNRYRRPPKISTEIISSSSEKSLSTEVILRKFMMIISKNISPPKIFTPLRRFPRLLPSI